jgi:hypothetical protein
MNETRCPACGVRVPYADGQDEVTCDQCLTRIPIEVKADAAGELPFPKPEPVAATSGAEHAPLTFPVKPFEAVKGGHRFLTVVPLGAGLFAAIVLSVVCAILQGYLWLIVVFPLLHGAALGLAIGLAARLMRFRRHGSLVVIGFICAVLSVFGVHFLEYLAFIGGGPGAPQITFWQYMDLQATLGVQLSKAGGGGGGGANLGYTGSIIYWVVEAFLTALGAIGVPIAMVSSPFCENCNVWKRKRTHGPFKVEPTVAVQAVANGVPGEMIVPSEGDRKSTLTIYSCPYCAGDAPIDVKFDGSITEGKKTWCCNVFVSYPGEALAIFDAAVDACEGQGLKTK